MPIQSEWWSIVPGAGVDIWSYVNSSETSAYKTDFITPKFGYNSTTKNDGVLETSYWRYSSATELHAIRFLGTEYCSAWKYELLGGWSSSDYGYLRVSATLIGYVEKEESAAVTGIGTKAEAWYNAHSWNGSGENAIFWGNSDTMGAAQRLFYALGLADGGSKPNANRAWEVGTYTSATENPASSPCVYWLYFHRTGENNAMIGYDLKNYGVNVRLFRDN